MTTITCRAFAITCVVGVTLVFPRGGVGDEAMTESRSVQLGGAEEVVARIELGVGDLEVGGGALELMEAEFSYSSEDWRPRVDYSVAEGIGELSVRQPSVTTGTGKDIENAWKLRFADGVPIRLTVELGAGDEVLRQGRGLVGDGGVGGAFEGPESHRRSGGRATHRVWCFGSGFEGGIVGHANALFICSDLRSRRAIPLGRLRV